MAKKIPLKLAAVVIIVLFGLLAVASMAAPFGVLGSFGDGLAGGGQNSNAWAPWAISIGSLVLSAFSVVCGLMRGGFVTRRVPEGLMTVFLWIACVMMAFNAVFSLATLNSAMGGIEFAVTLMASIAFGRLAAEPRSPKQPVNPALNR